MIASSSQSRSATSMTWVEKKTVPPAAACSRMSSLSAKAEWGSSPTIGSSRIQLWGAWMRLAIRLSFMRMPRLMLLMGDLSTSLSSKRAASFSMAEALSAEGTLYTSATKLRYSYALSLLNISGVSGTSPNRRLASMGFWSRSMPSMSTLPASAAIAPVMMRIVVVFPAPFGPRNP